MATIDSLPPDQRAVLQLVLKRGRGYDDIAAMLSIDRASVRQRALDALDALGPTNEVPALERALVTDYLLGQLPPRVAEQVHARLAGSPADHAWAVAVAGELAELGGAEPAEIPELSPAPAQASGAGLGQAAAPAAELGAGGADREAHTQDPYGFEEAPGAQEDQYEVADGVPVPDGPPYASDDLLYSEDDVDRFESEPAVRQFPWEASSQQGVAPERERPPERDRPSATARAQQRERAKQRERASRGERSTVGRAPASSRRGGAVLLGLGALVIAAAVVAVLLLTGGSSPKHHAPPAQTTTTSANQAKLLSTIQLTSPTGKKKTVGYAQVIRETGVLGIVISAAGLPANSRKNAYAVWLYSSPTSSYRVGFVDTRVMKSGLLQTDGPLPSNAASYKQVLLTLETARNPTQPGAVILRGPFTTS